MTNKKKNKTHGQKSSSNVISINIPTEEYQLAFKLYRKHPSIPSILNLLSTALAIGAQMQEIENELSKLANIGLDQFYGHRGSPYFQEIDESDFEALSSFRPLEENTSAVCELLWAFLENIQGEEIWGIKHFLVGIADYKYLSAKSPAKNNKTPQIKNDEESSRRYAKVISAAHDAISASIEKDKAAKESSAESRNLGFAMVPFASWASDIFKRRQDLKNAISDLSEYLDSYYTSETQPTIDVLGNANESIKLSAENNRSIAKIFSLLIFLPLFKNAVYKGDKFIIEDFWGERLDHLSSRDAFDRDEDKAEYIIGISNLLMINAKLDVASVLYGLATDAELAREYLYDVDAECVDQACLALIPGSGFAQLINAINQYEGEGPEEYALTEALRVTAYGVKNSNNSDAASELFDTSFRGISPNLQQHIREKLEFSIEKWLIPIFHTHSIAYLYPDFWSDEIIVDKISEAFFQSDVKNNLACRFNRNELADITSHGDHLPFYIHPAIFSRKFSNTVDFVDFSDRDWTRFSLSLESAGQTRYASAVLALYLTICGVKRFYNIDRMVEIDVPEIIKHCKQLCENDSFSLVRQAISDLFEMYEGAPPLLKGSLQDYLPAPKAALASLKVKEVDRFSQYKKDLLETEIHLGRLSMQTQDFLVKGYTLARDGELAVYNLSSDAVRNYLLAVEGELRSRCAHLDTGLAEELKYLGIDIDLKAADGLQGRRGVFRGLGSICRMLDQYGRLSAGAKTKLKDFAGLAAHAEIAKFQSSMRDLIQIRNSVQHADSSSYSAGNITGYLSRVEDLLLNDGGIVRILCESR
jgi:hypothetical protein